MFFLHPMRNDYGHFKGENRMKNINEMGTWIETEDGRKAALVDGKIYVRNKKGRVLASVPKKVR